MIDLDLQTGALAVFLNRRARTHDDALCRGRKETRFDPARSRAHQASARACICSPRPSGSRTARWSPTAPSARCIEIMRQMFDFVIVDCGGISMRTRSPRGSARRHLFYVLDQSIGAARCAWRFVDLFGRLGLAMSSPPSCSAAISRNHPISEKQLESYAWRGRYTRRFRAMKKCSNACSSARRTSGRSRPGSPLAKSVEEMARKLDGVSDLDSRTQRFESCRAFSAHSAHAG